MHLGCPPYPHLLFLSPSLTPSLSLLFTIATLSSLPSLSSLSPLSCPSHTLSHAPLVPSLSYPLSLMPSLSLVPFLFPLLSCFLFHLSPPLSLLHSHTLFHHLTWQPTLMLCLAHLPICPPTLTHIYICSVLPTLTPICLFTLSPSSSHTHTYSMNLNHYYSSFFYTIFILLYIVIIFCCIFFLFGSQLEMKQVSNDKIKS